MKINVKITSQILIKLLYYLLILCYFPFYPYFDIIIEHDSNFLFIIFGIFPLFLIFLPFFFNKILSIKEHIAYVYSFLIIITFFIIALLVGCFNSHYFEIFTYEKWNNNKYCDMRYKMIKSLEKNYSLIGRNKKEIYEILGNPNEKTCSYDYEDTNKICYMTYEAMMRNDFYCLYLDENGIVTKTEYETVR